MRATQEFGSIAVKGESVKCARARENVSTACGINGRGDARVDDMWKNTNSQPNHRRNVWRGSSSWFAFTNSREEVGIVVRNDDSHSQSRSNEAAVSRYGQRRRVTYKRMSRTKTVLKARGIVFLGLIASDAMSDKNSGPETELKSVRISLDKSSLCSCHKTRPKRAEGVS